MTKIVKQTRAKLNAREQRMLRLDADQTVLNIRRLMILDGQVRKLVDMSFPEELVSGFENVNLRNRSIYDILKRRYGLVPASSELLNISVQTPLLGVVN